MIELSVLKPNEKNPFPFKKGDDDWKDFVTKIERDPEYLKARPIVYDSTQDNLILGGNKRYFALKDLGFKAIPENYTYDAKDWSEEKKRRFVYADNYNVGEWHIEFVDEDMADEWNIDFEEPDSKQNIIEDDHTLSVEDVETSIVYGDLIEINIDGNEHRIMCGDAFNFDDIEKLMNGRLANFVFTDPPYDIDSQEYHATIYAFSSNAHVFVMHDDKGIVDYLLESKLEFKRFYVADFGFSSPRGNDPYLRHILISQETNGNAIKHKNLHDGFSSIIKMEYRGNLKDDKTEHRHQKPISFVAKFIEHFSEDGFCVFDPFIGSGTTLMACQETNRICYGTEINPKSCQIVINRVLDRYKSCHISVNGRIITSN